MTHKSIEIPEEIYNRLLLLKQEDESLADFIIRLIENPDKNASIEEYAGIFKEDSEEWERIESLLYEQRFHQKKMASLKSFDEQIEIIKGEKDIGQILNNYSERLQKLPNPKEKIKLLTEIDDFLLENKTIIKEKYSSLVVSIFRSI